MKDTKRSTVMSPKALVATSQPPAVVQAGLEILKAGGDAADAACRQDGCAQGY